MSSSPQSHRDLTSCRYSTVPCVGPHGILTGPRFPGQTADPGRPRPHPLGGGTALASVRACWASRCRSVPAGRRCRGSPHRQRSRRSAPGRRWADDGEQEPQAVQEHPKKEQVSGPRSGARRRADSRSTGDPGGAAHTNARVGGELEIGGETHLCEWPLPILADSSELEQLANQAELGGLARAREGALGVPWSTIESHLRPP